MSMNLNQLVQGALNESVLQQLASRVGCTPESAKRVISLCGPALIGSMMNKASSLDGARNLFASVMSPSVNTHIADELPHFVVHDEGMQSLLATGASVEGAVASHDSLDLLSERIAEHTGVAAGATRTLTGVVGATILGLLKRYFTQNNGQVGSLPTLLGHQLPVVRANMTDSFAQALGLGSVGAFLAGVASRLKAVSSHLEHPATHEAAAFPIHSDRPAAPEADDEAKDTSGKRKWLWVANAAALALFAALVARGCSTDDKPKEQAADAQADASAASDSTADSTAAIAVDASASAPVQASMPALPAGKDAVASFTVDASGVPTLTAKVGSEQERQRLIAALSSALGADKFHANVTVDPDTKPSAWIGKLDKLLPVLNLPGARVRIAGDNIELDGPAADAKFGWAAKLTSLFGSGWHIGAAKGSVDAPASAALAASAVSVAANSEACTAPAIARTLNLQPINFRIGSNTPPAAAMAALAKSAKTLKACDERVSAIKLEIAGYSDNTGSPALNVALSKKRAEAVRAYLVKHGIPASSLTAQGFGEASPIASNATRAGRMANRRIEFHEVR